MDNETNDTTSSQTTLNTTQVVNIVLEALLMIVVCFGNVLVISAIQRRESLQTVTNYFIMHLALADFCIGIIMPMHIAMFLYRKMLENIHVCLLRYCSIKVTFAASVMFLLAIAVDRHTSIVYPLRYHVIMTKARARRVVITVWVLAISFGFVLPMSWHKTWDDITDSECDFVKVMKWEYLGLLSMPLFVVNTLAMVGVYCRIFHISHEQATRVVPGATGGSFRSNLMIAKTASIVLGLFIVCWYPFFIIMAVQVYGDLIYSERLETFRSYATILTIVNSALNPIVYAFRMENFRTEFVKLLKVSRSSGAFPSLRNSISATSVAMTTKRRAVPMGNVDLNGENAGPRHIKDAVAVDRSDLSTSDEVIHSSSRSINVEVTHQSSTSVEVTHHPSTSFEVTHRSPKSVEVTLQSSASVEMTQMRAYGSSTSVEANEMFDYGSDTALFKQTHPPSNYPKDTIPKLLGNTDTEPSLGGVSNVSFTLEEGTHDDSKESACNNIEDVLVPENPDRCHFYLTDSTEEGRLS